MKRILFSIGSYHVYGYGLMIALGIIAACLLLEWRMRKRQMDADKALDLVIWCAVGGLLGAKVLYWITILPSILADPAVILQNLTDGFVVYGGILGGILAGFLFCRIRKWDFLKMFDLAMPSVALGQAFGRVGCFLAGCCYGRETACAIHVVFPADSMAPSGVPLIPTQLMSAGLNLLHCILLILFARSVKHKDGQVAALYLICYSVGRFLLEFLRGDELRGHIGFLSTSQFIAIFILAAGLILFFALNRKKS